MIPLELLARIAAAATVFALIALWEVLAPRRPWSIGRRERWPHNIGILVIDALAVRILIPTAAVGAALFAAGNGWACFTSRACGSRSPRSWDSWRSISPS